MSPENSPRQSQRILKGLSVLSHRGSADATAKVPSIPYTGRDETKKIPGPGQYDPILNSVHKNQAGISFGAHQVKDPQPGPKRQLETYISSIFSTRNNSDQKKGRIQFNEATSEQSPKVLSYQEMQI